MDRLQWNGEEQVDI